MVHQTADIRDLGAYSYAQAGQILDTPASTVRAWKKGQKGFAPPIPTILSRRLSYNDLIEIYVLRSLRTKDKFHLSYIRKALDIANHKFGIPRLFLHEDFRYDSHEFFINHFGRLASLSPSRQMAMREVLEQYLRRIDYGPDKLANALHLMTRRTGIEGPKLLVVNPAISFGRPVVSSRGIRTAAIVSRLDAGESREHIIADFGLTPDEFDEVLWLEAA